MHPSVVDTCVGDTLPVVGESAVIIWASKMINETTFEWGITDCASLTLKALQVLTGEDYPSKFRGKWSNEKQARRYYDHGLPSDVLKGFGAEEIEPWFVVIGDVVTIPSPTWPEQLHFVLGKYSLVSDVKRGVRVAPTALLLAQPGSRVWRVAKCLKQSR